MRTTDITTKESDLNIVYGPHYIGDEVTELNLASVKYLYTDLTDIRKYYIRLGFHLDEFDSRFGYTNFGFATLYDFCEANLGLDKGAVSRCINVFREFNASNDVKYKGSFVEHGSAMDLSERWKDYSYTQLCEMLPLSEDERKNLTPDMTVSQIREYKKQLKQDRSAKDPVALTQPEDPADKPVVSPQQFDFDDYMSKSGIVRYNYVKRCQCLSDENMKFLYLFDERGKEIAGELQCDILFNDDNDIVIRLYGYHKPLEDEE